ncbi:MAG: hypothetical protein ABI067_05830 [Leifsonia sp.]
MGDHSTCSAPGSAAALAPPSVPVAVERGKRGAHPAAGAALAERDEWTQKSAVSSSGGESTFHARVNVDSPLLTLRRRVLRNIRPQHTE